MKSFVLNLEKNPERLVAFREGFPTCLEMPTVWRAKPPEECNPPEWWKGSPEFWSNTENVMDVLTFAKDQSENTLFFEDDCIFAEDFKVKWDEFFQEVSNGLEDYDLINLCTLHMNSGCYIPKQVAPYMLRAVLGFNTNALILTPGGASRMLEQLEKPSWGCKHICEQQLGYLYMDKTFKVYAPLQNFIGQRACYSELCKRDRGERWYNRFSYLNMDGTLTQSEGLYEKE